MTGPRERENVMKGTITTCLAEMVETKFGTDTWTKILDVAQIDTRMRSQLKFATADIPDFQVVALFDATAGVLGLTTEQAADAFGEYWCCHYAPNAPPPRSEYERVDDNTLEVTYKSHRNLLGIYMGLARGVGKLLGEPLEVFALDRDRVRIEFA
jgi:hypothetical protein